MEMNGSDYCYRIMVRFFDIHGLMMNGKYPRDRKYGMRYTINAGVRKGSYIRVAVNRSLFKLLPKTSTCRTRS